MEVGDCHKNAEMLKCFSRLMLMSCPSRSLCEKLQLFLTISRVIFFIKDNLNIYFIYFINTKYFDKK